MIIWYIISFILALLYIALMLFYVEQWQNQKEFTTTDISRNTTVSIIIPARNESAHILNCLDAVLHQNYPANLYEVIVIDDFSEDDTFALASSIQKHNLRVFKLAALLADEQETIHSYKKKAIEKAIDQSQAELIVCIDADVVMGEKWLRTLVAFYEQTQCLMIAAPVMFNQRPTFTARFQTLDFCGMMVTTAAVVESGNGLMCNGANLAYTRKAFHYVQGFKEVDSFGSGDDVFLMYKIHAAFPGACRFLKSKTATVFTEAQLNTKAFFNQRLRWASKNKHFKDRKINAQLVIILLTNLSIVFNFFCWMLNLVFSFYDGAVFGYVLLIQLGIKSLADWIYLSTGATFFNRKAMLWWFIPAQVAHIIYISVVGVLGNFSSYQWKGRMYTQ